MRCPNCGAEASEKDNFCGECGKVIGTESKPSGAWYLVPIFFGIIGGIIGYFALKGKNNGMHAI